MNRTLVISIDALISADIERLKKLPNLGRIMKQASWAEDILCCYPTLTYPCPAITHYRPGNGCSGQPGCFCIVNESRRFDILSEPVPFRPVF